jgi:hypothetical protein
MPIKIICSPNKTLETCARIATVVVQDPAPNEECLYLFGFKFPQGMNDIAQPPVGSGKVYQVQPNTAYDFLIKADTPGAITMIAKKNCNDVRNNESDVADYEILECNDANARQIGLFTGIGVTTIAIAIIAGTKLGGGVGSVGGPGGILAGLVIGGVAGGLAYLFFRPDCCKTQAEIDTQGRVSP